MRKLSLLIFTLVILSCTRNEETTRVAAEESRNIVEVHKVDLKEITPEIDSFGSISFSSKADVTSTVDGTISAIKVEEGDKVYKGQLLAQLTNIQLQIRKDQALSALESSKAALQLSETKLREGKMQVEARLLTIEKLKLQLSQKNKEQEQMAQSLENKRELFNVGGISEEELTSMELNYSASETAILSLEKDIIIQSVGFRDRDILNYGYNIPDNEEERTTILKDINTRTLLAELNVAKSRVETAETELKSAEALREELSLKAPISGIIGAKYMELGERAKADTKVFTIFDSNEVDISFPVPEAKGILLTNNLEVKAIVDSLDGKEFKARIRQISPMVDPKSGNITIKANMTNKEGLFKPGMFTRVNVKYGLTRMSVQIPETSIAQKKNSTGTIFLAVNSRVFRKEVELGVEKNGMVEVTEGLAKGDFVINSPSPLLREGEQVDVKMD